MYGEVYCRPATVRKAVSADESTETTINADLRVLGVLCVDRRVLRKLTAGLS